LESDSKQAVSSVSDVFLDEDATAACCDSVTIM